MPTVLTRVDVLAAKDTQIEFVAVPEWSDDPEAGLYVKGLSGTDRDLFELAMLEEKRDAKGKRTQSVNLRNLRAKLVVRCAVDGEDPETAKPIFQLSDVEALGQKSAAALQRVYSVAQRLSGLSNEDVDELTEELKNDPSDGSGSDSQDISTSPSPMLSAVSAATNSQSGSHETD